MIATFFPSNPASGTCSVPFSSGSFSADTAIRVYHGWVSTIVLIGYRGTGKSTLGSWLANELGVPFIDTDEKVLEHLGFRNVKQAWAAVKEGGWREAEREIIPLLFQMEGIIALGGGAPLLEEVGHELRKVPLVIHLWAEPAVITSRLAEGDDRPALSQDDLDVMYARLPQYTLLSMCDIDTSGDLEETKAMLLEKTG